MGLTRWRRYRYHCQCDQHHDNMVVATVDVGANPRGLDGTPDGRLVFIANRDNNTVSVIETATNTVTKTLEPLPGLQ